MKNKINDKVLILSLQGLGNTIMLTRILRYMNEENKVRISLVLSDNGSYQYVNALNLTNIENIYVWNEGKKSVQNVVQLVKQLRKNKFNTVYATYPSGKRENTLLFFSRAKEKRIFKYYKGFFRTWQFLNPINIKANHTLHDIENNALLFGILTSEINKKYIKINFSNELYIGLHIGSKALSKRWEIYKWSKLMKMLRNSFKCKFVVIAGKNEMNLIDDLNYKVSWNFDAIVGSGFKELINRLNSLTLLIGNDSAIAHLSSLLGVPTIVIWSYTQFWRVCPYGKGNIVIKKNYECIPCYDFVKKKYIEDCQYHLKCIRDIRSEDIFEIAKRYIMLFQRDKIPSDKDFRDLQLISKTYALKNGCIILSLKNYHEVYGPHF